MNKQTLHEISILLTNPLYFDSGIRKGGSNLNKIQSTFTVAWCRCSKPQDELQDQ